jgi:hypothetical protein
MPHAPYFPTAPPRRAEADRPADPTPAIRASSVCPNCGRSPAVVFPDLRTRAAAGEARLVCLECCPKAPGEAGGPAPAG